MHDAIASPLEAWASFYVIVGSSAAALTGLQFVVMTLIVQSGYSRTRGESIAAFGTPTVIHFSSALLVASILTAPWHTLRSAGLAVATCGALGAFYSAIVIRRARRQSGYQPVLEDWIWHTILPPLAYSALLVAGAVLRRGSSDALFVIAAAVLLLVLIGIHNAWDTVTYVAVDLRPREPEEQEGADAGAETRTEAAETRTEAARGSGAGPSPAAGASRPSPAAGASRPSLSSGPQSKESVP
jgi:hypothetical protein